MDISKIQPVGTRCLVQVEQAATQSESGLYMENNSNVSAAPSLGVVLKAGESSKYVVGQKVFFRRFSLDELKVITPQGEQTINLVEDDEVVAIFNNN